MRLVADAFRQAELVPAVVEGRLVYPLTAAVEGRLSPLTAVVEVRLVYPPYCGDGGQTV